MFQHISGKCRGLGILISVLGIPFFVIYGIVLCVSQTLGLGFLYAIVGSLSVYLTSCLIYGFGVLIANTCAINKKLSLIVLQKNKKDEKIEDQVISISQHTLTNIADSDAFVERKTKNIIDINKNDYNEDNTPRKNECPNCFAKINSRTRICSNCGYKIKDGVIKIEKL